MLSVNTRQKPERLNPYLKSNNMATVIEGIKFYTIQETAKALKVTPQTIRLWVKQGRLKGQRIGRPILITEKNILEFLQASN